MVANERKNRNWKKWNFGYIAERHIVEREKAIIKLPVKQKTIEL